MHTQALHALATLLFSIYCTSLLPLSFHKLPPVLAHVWHLNQSYTLNVDDTPSHLVDATDDNAGNLAFYPFPTDAGANDPSQNPFSFYAYLCFISSSPHTAHYLSICMSSNQQVYTSQSAPDNHTPVVWSANRNKPANGRLIRLALQADGDLVLQGNGDTEPAWRTATANKGVTRMELLQYPINLVLYGSADVVVWQSMHYPSNTLTYTQSLKAGMELVSWASPTDLSMGKYSMVLQEGAITLSVTLQTTTLPYWRSSPLIDNCSTDSQINCSSITAYLGSQGFILDYPDDSHHATSVLPCQPSISEANTTFLRLGSDGTLHLYVLRANTPQWINLCESTSFGTGFGPCSLPLICGPYGVCVAGGTCVCPAAASLFSFLSQSKPSKGCSLTQPLDLRCTNKTTSATDLQMLDMPGYDYFYNSFTPPLSNVSTAYNCRETCLNSCSCLAAFWHATKKDCFHVSNDIWSMQGSLNTSEYHAYLKFSPLNYSESSRSKLGIILGSTLGGALVGTCTIIAVIVIACSWKKSKDIESIRLLDAIPGLPTRFTYKELQVITHNFSKLLGKGGFGAVYAGVLGDGTRVAVKQLESVKQGDKEFHSEVAIMAGIHHFNLLRLLGFCLQGAHRLLVYEHMENGSLDQWLFNSTSDEGIYQPLPWDMRCKIALGAARGLAYLHEECREKILHLDVKPQNILLDGNFVPKVADFGLSRLVQRDQSRVFTTMRGTPGYLAPEWLKESTIDEKCDVFSYGMLLLEIISGRKNLDLTQEELGRIYYPDWAFWQAQSSEYHDEESAREAAKLFTDAELQGEADMVQLRRMINTAFLCVLEEPTLRPSMEQVVQMLEGLLDVTALQLSALHQGLLFVLKSPAAYNHMEETVRGIYVGASKQRSDQSSGASYPAKNAPARVSTATMSLEISAR